MPAGLSLGLCEAELTRMRTAESTDVAMVTVGPLLETLRPNPPPVLYRSPVYAVFIGITAEGDFTSVGGKFLHSVGKSLRRWRIERKELRNAGPDCVLLRQGSPPTRGICIDSPPECMLSGNSRAFVCRAD